MQKTGQEGAAPRQLSLLQWDLLAAGRGYCCLAALDFAQARSCFAEILAVLPAQDEALRGMQLLHEWEETLREAQELPAQDSIPRLWRKIQRMPDLSSANIQEFRRALILRLLEMMTGAADQFHPPDLCRGALLLELNEPAAAERELRKMLTRHPQDGRLYGLLALALRRQGRREAAPALTSALLLSPDDLPPALMQLPTTKDIIHEHGPALTPAYGYLAGLLPLPEDDFPLPDTPAARLTSLLRQAEQARRNSDHPAMLEARRALKAQAPEFFAKYLSWLQGGESGK